jgi:oxygen-independent coproporphyrinogen III oxidase
MDAEHGNRTSDELTARPDSFVAEAAYFHVPFCSHRCGYCNFALVAGREYLVGDYLKALAIELAGVPGKPVLRTVYLGGGTPTRLPPREFGQLMELIEHHFAFHENTEFTIEANPEDIPGPLSPLIADSRINRVSLGIQSFDTGRIRSLDRRHSSTQSIRAMEAVLEMNKRLSADLIFGLAGDTEEIWSADLKTAVDGGVGHLSTYELTIEKGTAFWNRQNRNNELRGDEDALANLYELTIDQLASFGFTHYEVSSFCRDGEESRHNQTYWRGEPWYAFGPSATSYSGSARQTRIRSLSRYLKSVLAGKSPLEETQQLLPEDRAVEEIIFGLRMLKGVNMEQWRGRHASVLELQGTEGIPADLSERGLIQRDGEWLRLTRRGLLLADWVCQQILEKHLASTAAKHLP